MENSWLNNINRCFIQVRDDYMGPEFCFMYVPFMWCDGYIEFLRFHVEKKQVFPVKGNDEYANVLLGDPDDMRIIVYRHPDGDYVDSLMSNSEIVGHFEDFRMHCKPVSGS